MKTEKLNIQVLQYAIDHEEWPKIAHKDGDIMQVTGITGDAIDFDVIKSSFGDTGTLYPAGFKDHFIHHEPEPKTLTREEAKAEIWKICKSEPDHGKDKFLIHYNQVEDIIDRMQESSREEFKAMKELIHEVFENPAYQTDAGTSALVYDHIKPEYCPAEPQTRDEFKLEFYTKLLKKLGDISSGDLGLGEYYNRIRAKIVKETGNDEIQEPAEDPRIDKALKLIIAAFENPQMVNWKNLADTLSGILKGES